MNRMAFMIDDIHAPREQHDGQRTAGPGRDQEGSEYSGQQQPEEEERQHGAE